MAHKKEYIDDQTGRIINRLDCLDSAAQLLMKDLPYIRMAMINVSVRWYSIGVHFGLHNNTLDGFRSKNRNDSDKCLTCVIVEWIKNYPKKLGPPTWRKVAIAVSSRVGGDNPSEACRIAKECDSYGLRSSFNNSEEVDNRPLTSESCRLVVDAIMDGVADKWISIGLFLGIPYKVIHFYEDEEDRITKMVDAWMNRQYDVEVYGEPSWRKLTEAIAARSGGCHQRLASTIAKNHPVSDANDPQPLDDLHPVVPPSDSSIGNRVTSSSHQPPDVITEADLASLTKLLKPVAAKWELLCLNLGVPMADLKIIASHPLYISGGTVKFLLEGLYLWLQRNSGSTISVLISALQSIDENVLGHEIKGHWEEHRGPRRT